MNSIVIGSKGSFAIEYSFFDETCETEISMYLYNNNVLGFIKNGLQLTTRWNLDDLAEWLRSFIDNMCEDPYPVETCGTYAAEKDISARYFDSEDDDEFEAYYNKLYDWDLNHRWHQASSGAILADVYFQLVGDNVEISWNNTDCEEGVSFNNVLGGNKVPRREFEEVVDGFLKAYADHWYS